VQEEELRIIEIVNAQGSSLKILNLGASLFSFTIANKNATPTEVVAGPASKEDFLEAMNSDDRKFFGASIGRYAGRIAQGRFHIGEEEYQLEQNMDGAHLHGGAQGMQTRLWNVSEVKEGVNPSIKLIYVSEHLEEGYPGELEVTVTYVLTEENEIKITYHARTDRKTIVNLTNHTYFNLNGGGSISDHFLQVNASKILELDESKIPTGNLTKLRDQAKDYRENKLLGNRELDDVFILDVLEEEVQAQLFAPLTGIKLKVYSNQPVLVVYSPERFSQALQYHHKTDEKFPGVAIEAQNYPDAPNFRNFPSSLLKPGELYENQIVYAFSVK